ncbi:hypothetical protein [Christiangramia sp.]|uniref:hypothetical protein n=1 Tax=Christiangramia sp. TaxID=1931228 RepID=UPI00262C8A85|nr:hypothetical protein [Christiangramia sp.]
MKTLLYQTGLLNDGGFEMKTLLINLFIKFLMIAGIAFLVFKITSINYSSLNFMESEVPTIQKVTSNPPLPF